MALFDQMRHVDPEIPCGTSYFEAQGPSRTCNEIKGCRVALLDQMSHVDPEILCHPVEPWFTDYSQVDRPGVRYKAVNFGTEKSSL